MNDLDYCHDKCSTYCTGMMWLSDNPLIYDECYERCMEKCLGGEE